MKTLSIKYSTIIIFLIASSAIYSQTDSNKIYYANDISIQYDNGRIKDLNIKTGIITMIPDLMTYDDISKIRFLNDSLIRVSNDNNSDLKLNINKINGVSIKSGSYSLIGTILGATAGIIAGGLIGYAIGKSTEEENPVKGWFYIDPGSIGAAIGAPLGGIIGGIIGNSIGRNTDSYKAYDIRHSSTGKKNELERILRIDKNNNSK